MWITRFLPALVLAALIGVATSVQAAEYLSVADDLPLPNGFIEQKESAVIFDKPDGRLVETRADGNGNLASVRAFYLDALPALGWQYQAGDKTANTATARLTFIRDQELLTLTIQDLGATREITVTLEPLRGN